MYHSIYTLLIALLFFSACKGQVNTNSPQNEGQTPKLLPFQNELAKKVDAAAQFSEYVVSILEDSKGNYWFGTISDGVICYEGKDFTYFSTKDGLCDNTIASIAEDKAGNIWLGTHNGVVKYDGKTFTNFTEKEGISGAGCKILVDSKGNIWAGTNHGAFVYNGNYFVPFELPKPTLEKMSYKWEVGKVWEIKEDNKGNIWFGRDGFGACKYDGKTFTHFTEKDGLCSNTVSRIEEDKQGNLWFACLCSDKPKELKEGGLCRYDGKTFTKFPEIEGLSKNDLYSVYSDKKGNVWIGATGLGVYCYEGKNFKLYKGTNRMDLTWHMGIQSIKEDTKGNLWLGFSGGLFYFNGKEVVNVTKETFSKYQEEGK